MAIANDLLDRAIEETKHLHINEIFLVRDLFKGYEWNRMDSISIKSAAIDGLYAIRMTTIREGGFAI